MLPEGGVVEGQARDGGGDKIDGHDVQHGVGIAGHGAPQTARVDFQRPVHHLEAGGDAGARIADDDAGAQNDAGQRTEARADQRFGFGLGLLVGVAVALADGEFVFAHQAGALAGDVGRADIGKAAQLARGGGEIEHAARAFDVDAARFVQRVVETHRGGGVDDAGCLGGEALVQRRGPGRSSAGLHLRRRPRRGSVRRRGTIASARCWPDWPGRSRMSSASVALGCALEQFAHQLRAEKAGGAGDQDEFFVIHADTDLIAANNFPPQRAKLAGDPEFPPQRAELAGDPWFPPQRAKLAGDPGFSPQLLAGREPRVSVPGRQTKSYHIIARNPKLDHSRTLQPSCQIRGMAH